MRTVTEKYKAVNEGKLDQNEFVRQMRLAYPSLITQFNGFKDTVKILSNRGMLFEDKYETVNHSDESIRRGLDYELNAMGIDPAGTVSGEDQQKARNKALANIKKDPLYYYHLLSGDSSRVNRHDKYTETKRGKLEKDTFNDMKKATLKEIKQNLVEGTRALVGYLSGDRLTTTYNHYDGYPSNLGKGLEAHYNDDESAKDVAMKGYITYLNPETGEIESTHKDPPRKITLPDNDEDMAREVAEAIDSMGADYGYIWDDRANRWVTVKNTGIRSMIDQIMDKMGDYADVQEGDLDETEEEYLAKRDAAIKKAMGKDEMLKESLTNIITYLKQEKGAGNEVIKDFIKTHGKDIAGMSMDQVGDEFEEFLSVNYEAPSDFMNEDIDYHIELLVPQVAFDVESGELADSPYEFATEDEIEDGEADVTTYTDGDELDEFVFSRSYEQAKHFEKEYPGLFKVVTKVSEKKGKDHDGDGDIDGDDYMAAKDKAIKKAMGKKTDENAAVAAMMGARAALKNKEKDKKDVKEGYRGVMDDVVEIIKDMAMNADGDEIEAAMELMEFIGEHYKIDFEFGRAGGGNYGRNDGAPYEGKVNEAVKNIITKVLEEEVIAEAATQELAKIADEYDSFEGLKPAVIALENVVTEIETFYDKTRAKIQKIYNDLGEVRNEEGLKVGAFITPSIENAFKRDLKPIIKNQFHGGLEMPKVKRISQADVDRGYIQQEAPKDTVFTPVRENKKK